MIPSFRLRRARDALRGGGVIAYPTEAVYGLGCDPADPDAVLRVIELKDRDPRKGMLLIASSPAQLSGWVADDALADPRLAATWPGAVTWLVPAGPLAHPLITGGRARIGVRVTAHPGAAALCRAFGGPIVSTSANRTGRPPLRDALSVRRVFGHTLDAIVNGPTGGRRRPSEIRDFDTGTVVRG